jgi:competence protein ComEC
MLRLLVPFLAGIIIGFASEHPYLNPIHYSILLLIIWIATLVSPRLFPGYSGRWVPGALITLFLVLCGLQLQQSHQPQAVGGKVKNTENPLFMARISEFPSQTASGLRTIVTVSYRWHNGRWLPKNFQALAYIKRYKGNPLPMFGEYMLINAAALPVVDNANPNSFNYARYLYRKGVTGRFYADAENWKSVANKPGQGIRSYAFRVRDLLLDVLRENDVTGDEFAVAAALLLGYTGDLNRELLSDYAATGAMHVLSVSGMHVGVIWMFFEFLLGFLNRNRWGRWLKAILILTLIWFYSFMTGLAPCILRSAMMITLPILAKTLNRSSHMFNVIAASLFIMLALDPYVLLDIGFQLSYLAVAGLVVLYKPIYDLYITARWLPDKIWSLWAVSIAAQMATLPLTLYVFHQFPNYFLLTNLIVVPLSSLVIYTGIVLMACSPVAWLAGLIAKVLVFLIWLLNTLIHWIEGLPGSVWDGIFLSENQLVLLFILIIVVTAWLIYRHRYLFNSIIFTMIILTGVSLYYHWSAKNQCSFTVFNTREGTLVHFYFYNRAIVFYGTGDQRDERFYQQTRKLSEDNLAAMDVDYTRVYRMSTLFRSEFSASWFVPCAGRAGIIQFKNTRIAIITKQLSCGENVALKTDVVILSGNPRIDLSTVKRIFRPAVVVADGTNSRWRLSAWQKEAKESGMHFHSVSEAGAFRNEKE